uniref:DUF6009 family protein n=1 Tax=Streptomyces sp. NBC_00008 TaxID=2903610 RepID=A0AAU2W2N9_9ACTN
MDKVNTREGKPRQERDGRLIGCSGLAPKAPRSACSGLSARRTFYLLPHHDRPNRHDDLECPYKVGSPLEAVGPRARYAPGRGGGGDQPLTRHRGERPGRFLSRVHERYRAKWCYQYRR